MCAAACFQGCQSLFSEWGCNSFTKLHANIIMNSDPLLQYDGCIIQQKYWQGENRKKKKKRLAGLSLNWRTSVQIAKWRLSMLRRHKEKNPPGKSWEEKGAGTEMEYLSSWNIRYKNAYCKWIEVATPRFHSLKMGTTRRAANCVFCWYRCSRARV